MKTILLKILFVIILLLVSGSWAFPQMSISPNGSSPDNSAMLDVKSTNKGFLPPRVALTAINSANPVISPATGLLVYNTATMSTPPNNIIPGFFYWNGTRWISVPAGAMYPAMVAQQ